MARKHPPCAPELRRQMIELVRAGCTPEEPAKEFEPLAQAIRNLVAQADRDEGRRQDGLTTAEHGELNRATEALFEAFLSGPTVASQWRRILYFYKVLVPARDRETI